MIYAIRDVDKGIYNLIHSKNFVVVDEGMSARVRVLMDTPDEALAKKTYPCIYIDSGFNINTPEWWQSQKKSFSINEVDNHLVDVTTERQITVFYDYRVGLYVKKKSHCNYLVTELISLLPNNFDLAITNQASESDKVWFQREGSFVSLDESDGDEKLYRREVVLTAQLLMEKQEVESLLRPFTGVDLSVNSL